MKLTAHVLVVWPKPVAGGPKPVAPYSVLPWIEYGTENAAHEVACEAALRHEKNGWPTDQVTVQVESTTACPTATAVSLALHELGHRNAGDRGALILDAVGEDTARTVSVTDAVAYLDTAHELQVDAHESGYDTVILRLARRAEQRDPYARLALAELAAEARRADDNTVAADVDALTFAALGGRR